MGSPYQYSMALGCDFRSRTGYLFVCCSVILFFFSFPFFLFSFYILFYSLLSLSADCQVKYRSVSHHRLYRLSHWLSDTPGRSLITTNITNILVRKCCSSPKISENPHSLNQRVQLACSASLWPPFGGINPSPQSHTRMEESLFFAIFLSTATTTTTATYTYLSFASYLPTTFTYFNHFNSSLLPLLTLYPLESSCRMLAC